ncbi:hypothetical protein GWI33_022670 [Rhynchophorus ferrugineus]|uniref:Uncharacterized protein n=1 Tax=Rhynchophorus ferrugineus TaxID=354439 RepID=A0A834MHH0_RHYFE|nr:hypothetical protein GWI33_022670 [Rhynchophorus ferrugineus]
MQKDNIHSSPSTGTVCYLTTPALRGIIDIKNDSETNPIQTSPNGPTSSDTWRIPSIEGARDKPSSGGTVRGVPDACTPYFHGNSAFLLHIYDWEASWVLFAFRYQKGIRIVTFEGRFTIYLSLVSSVQNQLLRYWVFFFPFLAESLGKVVFIRLSYIDYDIWTLRHLKIRLFILRNRFVGREK